MKKYAKVKFKTKTVSKITKDTPSHTNNYLPLMISHNPFQAWIILLHAHLQVI